MLQLVQNYSRFGLVRSKRLVWFVIAIIFISLVAVVLVTTLLLWQSTDASSVAPDQRSITSTSTEAFVQATNTTETTIIRKKSMVLSGKMFESLFSELAIDIEYFVRTN